MGQLRTHRAAPKHDGASRQLRGREQPLAGPEVHLVQPRDRRPSCNRAGGDHQVIAVDGLAADLQDPHLDDPAAATEGGRSRLVELILMTAVVAVLGDRIAASGRGSVFGPGRFGVTQLGTHSAPAPSGGLAQHRLAGHAGHEGTRPAEAQLLDDRYRASSHAGLAEGLRRRPTTQHRHVKVGHPSSLDGRNRPCRISCPNPLRSGRLRL